MNIIEFIVEYIFDESVMYRMDCVVDDVWVLGYFWELVALVGVIDPMEGTL